MQRKLMTATVALALVASGVLAQASAAPGSCPEGTRSCQPVGDRIGDRSPRPPAIRDARQHPQPDDSIGHLWRAGSHLMY